MISFGSEPRCHDGVPGFLSIWRMEIKVLMWTIVVMGCFLMGAQLIPQEIRLGKNLTPTVREENFNSCGYSLQIRETDQVNQLRKPNYIQNSSTDQVNQLKKPNSGAIKQENSNKRVFLPYGNAAYLFIQMGAYRGGPATFSVIGLASKALHVFGKPQFECEWIPKNSSAARMKGKTRKILPDWNYGRVYTVVVVICRFSESVGTDGDGGELILHALHGNEFGKPERIVALKEEQGTYNASVYSQAPPYEYLYCGSSLYGDLSPQRMREWMAYHAKFFGPRSHFVFHDAGGVHPQVREMLEPWIRAGRVTLQDITEQEQYDGYYHNQFLIVNDCLHRYKFMANWTFFFDVDEYLYIPHGNSLRSVVNEFSNCTQLTIEQFKMSDRLCLQKNLSNESVNGAYSREWGFEKLVFRNVQRGIKRDRKYAVQARHVQATGVHMSKNFLGRSRKADGMLRYYHYHNTITNRGEPCREFAMNNVTVRMEGIPYVYDGSMKALAPLIQQFERKMIRSQLAAFASP